jgi:ubiquinone/menaquinone biosynthesis C-methylase UbiE
LDVGCGTGSLLKSLETFGFPGSMMGCDVSREMLDEFKNSWTGRSCPPTEIIANGRLPYENNSFEVLVACAVFHHVPPAEQDFLLSEIRRVLCPMGRFYLFEHNPWNPLTLLVVKTTEIDRNAILLSSRLARADIQRAFLNVIATDYLMFFPPRWKSLRPIERRLRWLPFGAQYVITASNSIA